MQNHAEQLAALASNELAEEIAVARELRTLEYMTGFALYDWERRALTRLVDNGRVKHDMTAERRYQLNDAGLAWLAEQES